MTEITHLVVNGDSYTYGEGLENREKQGWPYLLAKDLGCEVVNLAIPGTGNDTIHRRTYEYAISATARGNRPFFIIAWSQFWRKEVWFNDKKDYDAIDYPKKLKKEYKFDRTIRFSSRWGNDFQSSFLKNWNEEDHVRRTYLYKTSLHCLFKALEWPYLMWDHSSDAHTLDRQNHENLGFYDRIIDFYQFTHDHHHLGPICDLTQGLPKTKCGHDGVEGNIVIKDFLVNAIGEYYGDLHLLSDFSIFSLNDHHKIYG